MFSCLVTPIRFTEFTQIELEVKPRRRRPEIVGIRLFVPAFNCPGFLQPQLVQLTLRHYRVFKIQTAKLVLTRLAINRDVIQNPVIQTTVVLNSRVQIECVIPSSASEIQWVKSYIANAPLVSSLMVVSKTNTVHRSRITMNEEPVDLSTWWCLPSPKPPSRIFSNNARVFRPRFTIWTRFTRLFNATVLTDGSGDCSHVGPRTRRRITDI